MAWKDTETGELDFASFMIIVTNDFDSDGILNDQDQCPNTPLATAVNGDGCAIE
ncbi:thrombospondin type 3 repeat-containing protein [Vibrio diabolicus]|uniref:Thrombospondin type 3 repeat-containing protein n=1 Tax=Vibrio diabolicus TaxID=50719 RepID=A0AA92LSG4_9VIBR|nr:thrombospondin type 3 repeat-containing protein [Vibrio diabolicus]QRG82624.1 thrombospondin type 3 repeat-containing protein [Vibrio diabolicus]